MTLHQTITAERAPDAKTAKFLSELTSLSEKHGIGITGKPVLFIMEPEDRAFSYRIDSESNLSLG